jgi:hypothetical protein
MLKVAICRLLRPNLYRYKAEVKTRFQTKCRGTAEVETPQTLKCGQKSRVLARVLKFEIAYFLVFLNAFGCFD